jgi:hypothetical protein
VVARTLFPPCRLRSGNLGGMGNLSKGIDWICEIIPTELDPQRKEPMSRRGSTI